jgi:hypothetical protein
MDTGIFIYIPTFISATCCDDCSSALFVWAPFLHGFGFPLPIILTDANNTNTHTHHSQTVNKTSRGFFLFPGKKKKKERKGSRLIELYIYCRWVITLIHIFFFSLLCLRSVFIYTYTWADLTDRQARQVERRETHLALYSIPACKPPLHSHSSFSFGCCPLRSDAVRQGNKS